MQPHSGAIISALFHHHYHSPLKKKYRVRARFPKRSFYEIGILSETKQQMRVWVDGQFDGANFWNCDAKVDILPSERFRMRHHHSNVSREEWTISKNRIYHGEFESEKGYISHFTAEIYGDGKIVSFTDQYRYAGKFISQRYEYELEQ